MALTRYSPRESTSVSPWNGTGLMSNRLFRFFDEARPSLGSTSFGDWFPAVNVEETADQILLTAELAGVDEDKVSLEFENSVLTLSGEKIEERQEDSDRRYHVWERTYGSFQRSFTLPHTVDVENIEARFDRGILHVRIPKLEETKGRKIAIRKEG